jgi:hypothetical protein
MSTSPISSFISLLLKLRIKTRKKNQTTYCLPPAPSSWTRASLISISFVGERTNGLDSQSHPPCWRRPCAPGGLIWTNIPLSSTLFLALISRFSCVSIRECWVAGDQWISVRGFICIYSYNIQVIPTELSSLVHMSDDTWKSLAAMGFYTLGSRLVIRHYKIQTKPKPTSTHGNLNEQ